MNLGKRMEKACRLFGCDTARFAIFGKKIFLIIGNRRNTRKDVGQWVSNGKRVHFDYTVERCVASGEGWRQLWQSAGEYLRMVNLEREKGREATWLKILSMK